MPNLVVSAVTKYDGKGLAKGKKDIGGFDKSIKKLGKSLVGLYSVSKLAQFGKSSVKAFLADDKAAKALGKTLDNTGNSFAKVGVEKFIQSLQRQTGVLDDQLRPAFQQLLVATGSVTKAQEGLSVALDVAAGTSSDVVTTSKAISKAYAGNTTALAKLIPGIDKTVLASKDLNAINKELTRLFGGQAATAAGTFSGKLDILKASAEDAKETIGKGLVQSLIILGGNTSIADVTTKMDSFAESTKYATIGLADLVSKLGLLDSQNAKMNQLAFLGPVGSLALNSLISHGKSVEAAGMPNADKSASANLRRDRAVKAAAAAKAAADKKALDAAKKLAALTKKAETDKLALKKAGSVFDLARIQIEAALQYGIDNETKLRLELQRAILKEDVAKAAELQAALLANEAKTKDLANILATLPKADDPFADWPGIIARINQLLKDLKIPGTAAGLLGLQGLTVTPEGKVITTPPPVVKPPIVTPPPPLVEPPPPPLTKTPTGPTAAQIQSEIDFNNFLDAVTAGGDSGFAGAARRAGNPDPMGTNVYVTVNAGVVGSEQVIAQEVQNAISFLSRSGGLIGYAGQIAV
jgi:hypothetical protein